MTASVDPIVQCAACGAKLKLRAATLKVIKQVRCVKCQKTLEIPLVLKGGGPFPEGPVMANPVDSPAAPAPVVPTVVAPAPATASNPVTVLASVPPSPPAPASVPVPVPAPVPALASASASAPVPVPVQVTIASPVPPAASLPSVSAVAAPPGDPLFASRLAELERRLNAQQVTIETLSSQIRKFVQLQAAAANACLAGLA